MTRFFPSALFLSIALAGCGGSPSVPPAPSLTVTLDGQPFGGVLVQLVDSDGKGVATGTTDSSGVAAVRSGDGSAPAAGSYKVVLADTGDVEENPMEVKKAAKSRVPSVYGKAKTTTASVSLDGKLGPFPVEVKSK